MSPTCLLLQGDSKCNGAKVNLCLHELKQLIDAKMDWAWLLVRFDWVMF